MQNQPKQNRIALLALLVGALALCGCGAKVTKTNGSNEEASRTVNDAGASCNSFSSSSAKLTGKLQVYVDPFGQPQTSVMRVKITGIESAFDTNTKYTLKMYRWKANMNGQTYIDQNPLDVAIMYNGQQVMATKNAITLADLKAAQSRYGVAGSTSSEFFRNTEILVFDVDLTWDVLKIVLYENVSETESNVIGQVDTLMPAFSADPKIYAEDHPPVLQRLHPFYYDMNESMDFAEAAKSFCF